jgi:hypothetical protein
LAEAGRGGRPYQIACEHQLHPGCDTEALYSRDSGKRKLFDIRDRSQMPRETITRLNRRPSLENANVSPCGKYFAASAHQEGPDWSLLSLIHGGSQVFDQFFIEQIQWRICQS